MSNTAQRPIMIQGPMVIEAEKMAAKLQNVKVEPTGNFIFYLGTLDNYPVIVAKTSKGMENAAAATAVGIERYNPVAVINQGTAGGHDPMLNVGDIVLGAKTTPIGNLKTAELLAGQGSDPFIWKPMDVMASEGSAGEDKNAEKIRYYYSDAFLMEIAHRVKDTYTYGKIVDGVVGSANVWNNELDRIKWFHENYGTSVEEMEGAAVAQMCQAYNIPFLSIRVLSNNKTNAGKYNPLTAGYCQEYVLNVVKEYIRELKAQ